MITRIETRGFRSLKGVSVGLSRFHVLAGPNGSGKSTFIDVVGFLGDLAQVGPVRAIFGDPALGVPMRATDPRDMSWMRRWDRFELAIELAIPAERAAQLPNGKFQRARYEVAVDVAGPEVGLSAETLWLVPEQPEEHEVQRTLFPSPMEPPDTILAARHTKGWKKVVTKTAGSNDYFCAETSGWNNPFRLGPQKSALANLPEDEQKFPVATWVKRVFREGIQRMVLSAEAMRCPSPRGTTRFKTDGSNLPWVVERLKESAPDRFESWIDHVRTALPDLRSVRTVEREEDRHRYLVVEYESGLEAPAWLVSDGTLRLLALTILAYLPDTEGIYLIEEPENGIHPRAVETVYQSLASVYGAQILCASHSPVVLGLLRPADVLCFAKGPDGATDIVRGDRHPQLKDWKGTLDLGTLFASGVLG